MKSLGVGSSIEPVMHSPRSSSSSSIEYDSSSQSDVDSIGSFTSCGSDFDMSGSEDTECSWHQSLSHRRRRAFVDFSSVESAILHAEKFVLSLFCNIPSPVLPARPIHDCPYYGPINERGKRTGFGTFHYNDGCIFKGMWNEGIRCGGEGEMWYADGSYYKGEFRESLREGNGAITYKNGCKYAGTWRGDIRCTGHGEQKYADGSFYTGEFCGNARCGHGV